MHKWWVAALLAVAFTAIAYGFISLALDSGSWLEYGAGIFFLGWAVNRTAHAIRYLLDR